VPDYDLAAAAVASLRVEVDESILVPDAIPMRTPASLKTGLDLRATFVLMHVDGASTIAQISFSTQLPMTETMKCFAELRAKGLIELAIPVADGDLPPPPSFFRLRAADPLEQGWDEEE
jgi:hypothetical protein